MREKLEKLFWGRQGMDELSKALFWWGLAGLLLSVLLDALWGGWPVVLLRVIGGALLLLAFLRAFSRSVPQRETENELYQLLVSKFARDREARLERFRQRREFCFFKCPGCGSMIRVPRGRGRIHINCRCGYTLYRKT